LNGRLNEDRVWLQFAALFTVVTIIGAVLIAHWSNDRAHKQWSGPFTGKIVLVGEKYNENCGDSTCQYRDIVVQYKSPDGRLRFTGPAQADSGAMAGQQMQVRQNAHGEARLEAFGPPSTPLWGAALGGLVIGVLGGFLLGFFVTPWAIKLLTALHSLRHRLLVAV
jgi:hypothetical protein